MGKWEKAEGVWRSSAVAKPMHGAQERLEVNK